MTAEGKYRWYCHQETKNKKLSGRFAIFLLMFVVKTNFDIPIMRDDDIAENDWDDDENHDAVEIQNILN